MIFSLRMVELVIIIFCFFISFDAFQMHIPPWFGNSAKATVRRVHVVTPTCKLNADICNFPCIARDARPVLEFLNNQIEG